VDVDDALELLGPSFRNQAVRAYAVERLRKADDEVPPQAINLIVAITPLFTAARAGVEIREYIHEKRYPE
jgi:Phosphoinositide 3-kinase family, accessory domain (PIK domain)